ncbi:MAG: hypothetical protein IKZ82_10805 [Clostridia bacterium]|nr:hypothetical protein [Clostridia bacterium]
MSGIDIFLTALSVVSTVCAVAFGYSAFYRNRKREDTDSGKLSGTIVSELGYIRAGVDDLKREHRETAAAVGKLAERVTRVEESAKQAHHRISAIEGKKG